ncbi:MAG: hypothetical protein HYY20_00480 [Candidatus Tectomicrobia bacterium]|uniref:Methionyl-tRNA formyltransferase n=1 Tax=Tectimicrobiota bacterium TaxID=2528274 RepID=A0A932FU90_UNCTE|nr:hypothetical protein [Candidatus Tectomicrobia bacterium]
MKVILLGTREMGYQGLQALLEHGHEVKAVVTEEYEITEGCTAADFERLARQHGIPFFQTDRINNETFARLFRSLEADVGVSLYWRRLIRGPILSTTRLGFLNFHASDLPRYRGFAATSYAILRGEREVGLTIHFMADGVADAGDILLQRYLSIDETTTIATLFEQINPRAIAMMVEALEGLEQGTIRPLRQDESRALLAIPRLPCDGEIDWGQSAEEIDRLIRAVTRPYPGAFTHYQGRRLYLWAAHPLPDPPAFVGAPGHLFRLLEDGTAWVTTGRGILVLTEVQRAGEAAVVPGQLFRSVQIRLGMRMSEEIERLRDEVERLQQQVQALQEGKDNVRHRGNP